MPSRLGVTRPQRQPNVRQAEPLPRERQIHAAPEEVPDRPHDSEPGKPSVSQHQGSSHGRFKSDLNVAQTTAEASRFEGVGSRASDMEGLPHAAPFACSCTRAARGSLKPRLEVQNGGFWLRLRTHLAREDRRTELSNLKLLRIKTTTP
jgi:hypothetical protein